MTCTLKEFTNKLHEFVFSLGLDNKFIQNPGFNSSINDIRNIIMDFKIDEDHFIEYTKKEDSISFVTKSDGKPVIWQLEKISDIKFQVICRMDEMSRRQRKIWTRTSQYLQDHMDPNESKIKLDGDKTVVTYTSLNDNRCKVSYSNMCKIYDSYGINVNTRILNYKEKEIDLSRELGNYDTLDLIVIANRLSYLTPISLKIDMSRKYLDVADLDFEDVGAKYVGPIYLNSENGLKEMNPVEFATDEIEITPLTSEQIYELLSNEPIEMISDGLIRYTKDRDKYYYNSNDSKHFVYQTKIYR